MNMIPLVYEKLHSQHDFDFTLRFYFCEKDGFCKQNFKSESYPELRFYRKAQEMDKGFVLHRNPRRYDLQNLYTYFKTRISGISYSMGLKEVDEELNQILNLSKQFKEKILLFCKEDFNKTEFSYIKASALGYQDILSISIEDCSKLNPSDYQIQTPLLKNFIQVRKSKNKLIVLYKP